MTTNQIMYFLAVVKYKTFTQAAEELYTSQSSLSKQIKSLEDELGCTLFYRENKTNILTREGQLFLTYAEDFATNYDKLKSDLNTMRQIVSKQAITLGVLPIINEYNITKYIALFQTLIASSNVYINLQEGSQNDLLNMLHNKKIDSAIIRTDYINLTNYEYVNIFQEELVVIYPQKYTALDRPDKILSLSDIAEYPLIIFDESSSLHRLIQSAFLKTNLHPNYIYIYKRHEQILSMVNAGHGVSLVPKNLITLSNYPDLKIVHLDELLVSHTALIRLKNCPISKTTELLFEFFKSTEIE